MVIIYSWCFFLQRENIWSGGVSQDSVFGSLPPHPKPPHSLSSLAYTPHTMDTPVRPQPGLSFGLKMHSPHCSPLEGVPQAAWTEQAWKWTPLFLQTCPSSCTPLFGKWYLTSTELLRTETWAPPLKASITPHPVLLILYSRILAFSWSATSAPQHWRQCGLSKVSKSITLITLITPLSSDEKPKSPGLAFHMQAHLILRHCL